jgi:tetratricopeptide (TPR) repeat protein
VTSESQRQRLERCEAAVADRPDSAAAHYNLGLAYTVSGRVKLAQEAYLKAVELDPAMAKAWVNLGGVKMLYWDFKGALEANQQAVRIDADLVEAHFNMGQAYLYLNDPQHLLDCNQRVLELDPQHAEAHYYCAVASLALDDLGAAERYLGRATELGHRLPQEFLKAMEKARQKSARHGATLKEIAGTEVPEKPKEE